MRIDQIWSPPPGEKIINICTYRDEVIIATDWCVYRLRWDGIDYSITPIKIEGQRNESN